RLLCSDMFRRSLFYFFFFFTDPSTTHIYTLSLHDALPIWPRDFLKLGETYLDGGLWNGRRLVSADWVKDSLSPHAHISPETTGRSEEHTSELQSRSDLVCRLLLEKKKEKKTPTIRY